MGDKKHWPLKCSKCGSFVALTHHSKTKISYMNRLQMKRVLKKKHLTWKVQAYKSHMYVEFRNTNSVDMFSMVIPTHVTKLEFYSSQNEHGFCFCLLILLLAMFLNPQSSLDPLVVVDDVFLQNRINEYYVNRSKFVHLVNN